MVLDRVTIPSGEARTITGFLATPATQATAPGVVVLHEAWGVNPVMHRLAERVASLGYLALLPDLYSRGGTARCLVPTILSAFSGTGSVYENIEASRHWLSSSANCSGKVGVIGFCLGGGLAIVAASRGFDAAAANYGPLPRRLERFTREACPIVASYGRRDRYVAGAPDRLRRALVASGVVHDVVEYPSAGHAFMNDAPGGPRLLRPWSRLMGSGPDEEAATDAWGRIERFFAQHLG
jgi:carboxymethylenebutenolidase